MYEQLRLGLARKASVSEQKAINDALHYSFGDLKESIEEMVYNLLALEDEIRWILYGGRSGNSPEA